MLRWLALLVVALTAVCSPVWAAPSGRGPGGTVRTVEFRTDPPGARITRITAAGVEQEIGRSGQPVTFDLGTDLSLTFKFAIEGCQPRTERVAADDLPDHGRWPEGAPLPLEPVGGTPLPLVGLLVTALVVAVAAAGVHLARRRRAHRRLEEGHDESDPLAGTVLRGWRLLHRIGSGGTADVYRACRADGSVAAVKLLASEMCEDESYRARFSREARISQSLVHPNLLRVFDAGETDGRLYLVMELLEGETLRDRMFERGALDVSTCLRWLLPMMRAVAHAHAQGIVHRDLKPENVFISPRDEVKILDFGVARGDEYTRVTATGEVFGTMAYIATERLAGIGDDPRSDQYSLGVVAYEMLAGEPPHGLQPRVEDIYEPIPSIALRRADVPPALAAVVERMTALAMDARYPCLDAALQDLERTADEAGDSRAALH